MKRIMWTISIISLMGTAIVLHFMPEKVPMHYDLAGNIDRWGSKYENLIFPVIILVMALFWTLFIIYYEKKASITVDEKESASARTNAKVIGIVGLSMVAMFTIMQGFILYGAYNEAVSQTTKWSVDIGKVSVVLMGIIFIILGNFMTKTRINSMVGVRVSWSMYNDNTWRKSNRFGAITIMISGILTIITALFVKNSFVSIIITMGYLFIAVILTLVYAYKVYKWEISNNN